jgi:tetratricopeptide (TPR) repeat protein
MKQFAKLFFLICIGTATCVSAADAPTNIPAPSPAKQKEYAILLALSRAKPVSKQSIRLRLATEYVAQNRSADALDVLGVIGKNKLSEADKSIFLLLRGTAEFGMRHYAQARRDLESPLLENDPKAAILRAQLYEIAGEHALGILAFASAAKSFKSVPAEFLTPALISGARSQLALGRTTFARKHLKSASRLATSPEQRAEITLLQGHAAGMEGKTLESARHYAVAQAQKDPFVSAQATLNLVVSDLATGRISEKQAISTLQRLRLLWRGDPFELSVLEKIGDLYKNQNMSREALSTWRMVTRYFPASPDTRRIDIKVRELFTGQFSAAVLARRKPIDSLALFSDFRELTPLGADGDSLIRQLVNQMLDAGLNERAAGVLDYQVRYRLTGAAQSSVALQLAALQTQIGQSSKAIEILNSTKDIEVIPEISSNRRLVMACALTERGDFELALDMVRDASGLLPDEIRSDIYWRRKDWAALKSLANALAARTAAPKQILRHAYAQNMLGQGAPLKASYIRDAALLKTDAHKYAFTKLYSGEALLPQDIKKLEPTLVEIDALVSLDNFIRPVDLQLKAGQVPNPAPVLLTDRKLKPIIARSKT